MKNIFWIYLVAPPASISGFHKCQGNGDFPLPFPLPFLTFVSTFKEIFNSNVPIDCYSSHF